MRTCLIFVLLGLTPGFAQAPVQSNYGGVIRITVNLVQVDAVVTDSKSRQVTNLKSDDFEIFEDKRPQKITNFSYMTTTSATANAIPVPSVESVPALEKGASNVPPVRLRPEQVRRTIALVVDDLGLSFESTVYVRQALKKFVDEQVRPGDLVAILRTAAGMGALQQFTSDKRLLYAAIDRVRWYPNARTISGFAPMQGNSLGRLQAGLGSNRAARGNPETNARRAAADQARMEGDFSEEIYTVGTLGALKFVVQGLRDLPGRKSVILLSDSVPVYLNGDSQGRVLDALRALVDQANRSSVVMYSVDAKGLQTLALQAADNTSQLSPEEVESNLQDRRLDFYDSQRGMDYLSEQTGGFLIHDTNDLSRGIRVILEDLSGYYLIGYKPRAETFLAGNNGPTFHRIQVKLKVPGLNVRSRTGFYGVTDESARPVYATRSEQLAAGLTSPFDSGGVRLHLVSLFSNDAHSGSIVRSILHIDARDLTFTEIPGGWKKSLADVVAYTFGDNGRVIDGENHTYAFEVKDDAFESVLENGLLYTLDVRVKKPGAYQLRAAVRDQASQRLGSANQFVEVPDLRRDRLALSGIVVNGKLAGQRGPAIRMLEPGEDVAYGYQIYNARLDRTAHNPSLIHQVRVFHDRQEVYRTLPTAVDVRGQMDRKRFAVGGVLKLGPRIEPGDYVIEVTVTDKLAREKSSTASQWIDFEIAGADRKAVSVAPQ